MTLRIYNTLTRTKEVFTPIDPNNVRMYVCGPTVYDYAHIGNARPAIVFDVMFRLLRHLYGENHVTYVRNITDVDDKINARALRDYPGMELNTAIRAVTEKTYDQYQKDVSALGCLPPTAQPRATEHIGGMVEMIQVLLDKELAYLSIGSEGREILFDLMKMPDYGALSGRRLEDQQAGARVAVEPHKKNPGDFVLWKESGSKEPGWDGDFIPKSEQGYSAEFIVSESYRRTRGLNSRKVTVHGRPGWHIECSVMSKAHLGEVFDIHGGGLDLIFPHHENEIAQSRCANDTDVMANYWMHNGFLQVEGQKMSKSDGNFLVIASEVAKWGGDVLRFNMLKTHYRQPIDWTEKGLLGSRIALTGLKSAIGESELQFYDSAQLSAVGAQPHQDFVGNLQDDLNIHAALTVLHQLAKSGTEADAWSLYASLKLIGFDEFYLADSRVSESESKILNSLITARLEARNSKDWKKSDEIRDQLTAMGISIKDIKDPVTGELKTEWEVKR